MTLVDDAEGFLTRRGRGYAERLVAQKRLPDAHVDDVVQEAWIAVHRAIARGTEIDNIEAFVTTVIRRRVTDLLRGDIRRTEVPFERLDDEGYVRDIEPVDRTGPGADPEADVIALAQTASLRAAIGERLDGPTRLPAAGALAVLAHVDPHDPAAPADDCPQPTGGATPVEAAAWVGLFYAGRRGWWSDDDTPAIRQRRSRWARAQTELLEAAATDEGLHPGAAHA
ncbi:MAG: sigma-70 family RNA polymerase sigma factor [Acidimicrobiales bacterium]|nr:sigma-70 family RNA polymerase sigma factor [Acidimicrobiales bacterium]